MTCEHSLKVSDKITSENNPCKVTSCTKCGEVIGVVIRDSRKEPTQSVWDLKDRRIARMSVLKVASDLEIANALRLNASPDSSMVLNIAGILENWVYRGEV